MLISKTRQLIANTGWPLKLIVALCVVASVPLGALAQPQSGNHSARRGWLGLAADPNGPASSQGVAVMDVLAGSPAAVAGVRPDDLITAINGRPVSSYADLSRVMGLPPGTVLKLSVRRAGRVLNLRATLGEPPSAGNMPAPTSGAPPRQAPRNASPRAPAPPNQYGDEDDGDDSSDDEGYSGGGYSGGGGRASGNGYAGGNGNAGGKYGGGCSQLCRAAASCNALQFDRCSKLCANAARDGHQWSIAPNTSCAEVRTFFVTDQWMCNAQASVGSQVGNMGWVDRNQSSLGNGRSREEAATQALKNCGAFAGAAENLAELDGAAVRGGDCQIARCWPPGTALGLIPQ